MAELKIKVTESLIDEAEKWADKNCHYGWDNTEYCWNFGLEEDYCYFLFDDERDYVWFKLRFS